MVKYCLEKYPLGSFKGQQTPGKYMDGTLYKNLEIMARNISNDMTFLGVISSSTLEVGTGKSVLAQEIGEAFTELVNKYNGTDLDFTENNIVFRPEKLMERAPNMPKMSTIVLDEWDEKSYFDKLAMALRTFFRKCRQLNLFMIIIIPDFFQLPKGYAISRSAFFIDVKFHGEFQRGFFDFYNFERKKDLYIKAKKTYNFNIIKPNFIGRFTNGYAIGEENYRKLKYRDMVDSEKDEKARPDKMQMTAEMFHKVYTSLNENQNMTISQLSEAFGFTSRTGDKYLALVRGGEITGNLENLENPSECERASNHNNSLIQKDTSTNSLTDQGKKNEEDGQKNKQQ